MSRISRSFQSPLHFKLAYAKEGLLVCNFIVIVLLFCCVSWVQTSNMTSTLTIPFSWITNVVIECPKIMATVTLGASVAIYYLVEVVKVSLENLAH